MIVLSYNKGKVGDKMARQRRKRVLCYFSFIIFVFVLAFVVTSANKKESIVISNINTVKSIQSSRIIMDKEIMKLVTNTSDIKKYGKDFKVQFKGTLTGYGPDCPGCGGIVACKPNPNVQNGKIYYTDKEYGKIRILAADYSIPCGSIIHIENYKFVDNNEFYGIVLDRGSAIVGLTMDLLYPSEADTVIIGRQRNISFTIERWGW